METISEVLAVLSVIFLVLAFVALVFPKLAKTDRRVVAFGKYFGLSFVVMAIAVFISPTGPTPPGGDLIPPVEQVQIEAAAISPSQSTTMTSTGDGWACVTEASLFELIAAANAGDRQTASTMLGGECFQTRSSWTIHVQEEKEYSVSYSRVGDTLFWTTPDNIRTETY